MNASKQAPAAARPWERLDELQEYEQIARTRLEHVVPVGEPLVLISQVQRSGGTLLSQLFDGHPECHAHPHELKIAPRGTDRWPDIFLTATPEEWFEILYETKTAQHLVSGYSKPGLKSTDVDVFPFVFLPRLQKHLFDHAIAGREIERERDVIDCYFTSYFNAWLDNHNLYPRPKKIVTGFTPQLIEHPSFRNYLDTYPDGTVVSIVRDPRSWYASALRHRPDYRNVEKSMSRWRRSVRAAINKSRRFAERTFVMTYEQLVTDPEATMRRLADRLGITMAPVLLTPTFNGRPIRANSSGPVPSYGILADRAEAYRDVLDAETIARVDELAGDLYDEAAEIARAGT